MQSNWFGALVAWLNALCAFPWEDAADDELFLYAALITAAHY